MPKKKFNAIVIDARRWFDRINGNTYHSVAVYVDGESVGVKPFQYGYGDHYRQTAHKILQEANVFPATGESLPSGMGKDYYEFMGYMRDNRNKFVVLVVDVSRRGDLHEGGRAPRPEKPPKRRKTATGKKRLSPRASVRGLK